VAVVADGAVGRAIDREGEPGADARPVGRGGGRGLLAALLVAVNLPIVVATARALARGYQPLGDDGILLVRARDVATANNPLLGSWTSASVVVGHQVNNPGPLYFDAIAPAVRLLGPWVGVAVGVMLVNMAASSLAVVAGRRISGPESMVAVAVVVLGLQFAMGSELLYDVWQPNALVLPFFAFLVAVVVLATGDLVMLPWVVGAGSLVVQTHMSHAVLVAALTLVGVAGAAVSRRGGRVRGTWRPPVAWAVVVGLLAWAQPLYEQLFGRGEGNLSRIAGATGGGDAWTYGIARASQIGAEVATGPWFTRGSWDHAVPLAQPTVRFAGMPAFPAAAAILVGVVAVAAALAVVAARRGRRGLATLLAVAAAAEVVAVLALTISPLNVVGVAPHQMRWLWPVAALLTAALLTALLTGLRSRPALGGPVLAAGAAAALVLAAVNLPSHRSAAFGPTDEVDRQWQAVALVHQLDALQGRGTIRFDPEGLYFGEPFSGLVYAELQDLGIPFVFDDMVLLRQMGEGRRDHGDATLVMRQVEGTDALHTPEGAERVAFVAGLSPAERDELAAIRDRRAAGEPRPGDRVREAKLVERRGSRAVALFLAPVDAAG